MGPSYRNRDRDRNRNRSGYVDHDVFEGLPVRHWRRDLITIAPPPTQENTSAQNDVWAIELPHGMPKDSHLLPQHSQDLLRAARSGRIYKRPAPPEEEEVDVEAILGEKPEKKEEDPKDKGFQAKAWKQIPRHMEGADVEYLAKRRKGLITAAARAAASIPTVTKTTVKRVDAAGNEYVQDVVVPHGQTVEGEVIAQTIIPDPSVVVEGAFAAAAPPPPPRPPKSKKKSKGPGPGRGHKKKKPKAPTSVPQDAQTDGAMQGVEITGAAVQPEGNAAETTSAPANNEDTEMGDGSAHDSDDDDGEDGEEGEDEEEASADDPSSETPPQDLISPIPANPEVKTEDPSSETSHTAPSADKEIPGIPPPLNILDTTKVASGSPLKNVALSTSALTSSLEPPTNNALEMPSITPLPPASDVPAPTSSSTLDSTMQAQATETAPPKLPSPPPNPTPTEVAAAVEVRQEEEAEEEMILDVLEKTEPDAPTTSLPPLPANVVLPPKPGSVPAPKVEAAPPAPEEQKPAEQPSQPSQPEEAPQPIAPDVEAAEPKSEEPKPEKDDDDFPDLLGGLEKQLNKPTETTESEKPAAETTAPAEES